jgi:hypothetical protein
LQRCALCWARRAQVVLKGCLPPQGDSTTERGIGETGGLRALFPLPHITTLVEWVFQHSSLPASLPACLPDPARYVQRRHDELWEPQSLLLNYLLQDLNNLARSWSAPVPRSDSSMCPGERRRTEHPEPERRVQTGRV